MHPDDWLAQYNAKLRKIKEDADQAQEQLGTAGATVTSRDGQITVRVNSGGVLEDIRFGRDFQHPQPDRVAATIMECVRQAQREAAGQVLDVMQRFVGDSPALDFVKSSLPHGYAGDGTDDDAAPNPSTPHQRDDLDDDFDDNSQRSFLR